MKNSTPASSDKFGFRTSVKVDVNIVDVNIVNRNELEAMLLESLFPFMSGYAFMSRGPGLFAHGFVH